MKKNLHPQYASTFDAGLLLLRLLFGLSMLLGHGLGKWNMLFSGEEVKFFDLLGIGTVASLALAVFAEVICSLLLSLGLLTRWALIPLIITMAIAVFSVHINDGFNGMEKALLYGVGYISLFLTGPGWYSMDSFLSRKSKQ